MSDIKTTPYLFFKGECREAFEFYQSIFSGKLDLQTYSEAPANELGLQADDIMHVSLSGGAVDLMGSDTAQASPVAAKISIMISGTDEEKLTGFFEALSEGAKTQYSLKKEFWGDIFGTVIDKYNIEWMINISPVAK